MAGGRISARTSSLLDSIIRTRAVGFDDLLERTNDPTIETMVPFHAPHPHHRPVCTANLHCTHNTHFVVKHTDPTDARLAPLPHCSGVKGYKRLSTSRTALAVPYDAPHDAQQHAVEAWSFVTSCTTMHQSRVHPSHVASSSVLTPV